MFGRGHPTSIAYAMALVAGGPLLVGKREPGEFTGGHASGAVSAPPGHVDQHVPALVKAGLVLAIGASGIRSRTSTQRLRAAGVDASNATSGLRAWIAAGGPIMPGARLRLGEW